MKLSLIFAFAFVALVAPHTVSAATPSCSITVFTPRGSVQVTDKAEVVMQKDEQVMFMWIGRDAQRATDKNGNAVPMFGIVTVPMNESAEYSYDFEQFNSKATCGVSFVSQRASIDINSVTKKPEKPTIRGTAADAKSVTVTVRDDDGDKVYKKTTKVSKGVWKASVTKKLSPRSYEITLEGKSGSRLNTLATATFTVPEKGSTKTLGALSASQLPLLMGGNAAPGSSVPVAYVKLVNTSKEMAQIQGIELIQNGSASTDAVIGFATNDDKGGSRTTVGGNEGSRQFKGSKAYVPLVATLSPGQVRIFTIKALISRNSALYAGKSLMLDVASIDTSAAVKGTFPLRGTTFTLTR